jgi:predicted DNA-binding transcriptional regulator AlpA
MDSSELLTVDEFAALIRVPTSWVYARTCPGSEKEDCPPFLKLGRHLRFRRAEVEAWVERHHSRSETSSQVLEGGSQAIEKAQLN